VKLARAGLSGLSHALSFDKKRPPEGSLSVALNGAADHAMRSVGPLFLRRYAMKPIPKKPTIIMAQVGSWIPLTPLSSNTPIRPFGQIVLFGSAPKGTKNSPDSGSATDTEVFRRSGYCAPIRCVRDQGTMQEIDRAGCTIRLRRSQPFPPWGSAQEEHRLTKA
jgi:hypothetical protein